MIRVLVVDDSAYVRLALRNNLQTDPCIEVVETARDGLEAIEKTLALKPDVITLDLEMPRLDGFGALERIMRDMPTPVIVISGTGEDAANSTVRALSLGAMDFVSKVPDHGASFRDVCCEVAAKIKAYAGVDQQKIALSSIGRSPAASGGAAAARHARGTRGIIVIGASTGGPRALSRVLPGLHEVTEAGILIVQHMPAGFTKSLALHLDADCPFPVREAKHGDAIESGVALVAPGGRHLTVSRSRTIDLDDSNPEQGVRPSIDRTLASVADTCGRDCIAVILTGMGHDGMRGAELIHAAGGLVIAEHESTCVVYGMPRAVVEAGIADKIVPLDRVAAEVVSASSRTALRVAKAAG